MEHTLNLHQHLACLGIDVDTLEQAIPNHLTLSLQDGVLSLSQRENQTAQLSVDFVAGSLSYRSKQHLGGENLIKACQIKGQNKIQILDGTCGLGTDSFLLHRAGFKVTAIEKNPIVYALLLDGLRRLEQQENSGCFKLQFGDFKDQLETDKFDVIYLDPMFPAKVKSAKNKKTMQLFQAIHEGQNDDALQLLELSLKASCQRVVIKRPSKSAVLTKFKPTFQVPGKKCRFDAYQIS